MKEDKNRDSKNKETASFEKILASVRDSIKKAGVFIGHILAVTGAFLLDKIQELFFLLQDAYAELKIRHRKALKKREHLKAKLSPEKFKEYRRKEILRNTVICSMAAAAVLLCILLLVGIVKLLLFTGSRLFAKKEPETEFVTEAVTEKIYPEKDITIGSTGSMLLHSPFIDSYPDEEGNYDFSSIYTYITPYYSEPDFMTCEFEGAFGGPELGYSGYPSFKAPDVFIDNMRDSGIDLQLLASNHIYDGWSSAFRRTMEVYKKKQTAFTGIRPTVNDKQYYIADINGIKVGFLNYTYETTSQTEALGYGSEKSINGLVLESRDAPLLNSFDFEKTDAFYAEVEKNIKAMKNDGAQFLIANLHWGTEYQLQESDAQRRIAQKLCDMGIDAIIGGHPHCEQPVDVFKSADGTHTMFCAFSLGNALSNQRAYLMDEMPTGHTEDGAMVTMTLHQSPNGEVSIKDLSLLPTWVYRYQDNDGSKYFIFPLDKTDTLEENTGIADIEEEAQNSYTRTIEVMGAGMQKAKEAFGIKESAVTSQAETESETGEDFETNDSTETKE